ncbi:hypothetical protein BGZ90_011859 [Linnemannia elongata]|nr:hypothetical protein BGZ90_011859 [Linnemannia elongata]
MRIEAAPTAAAAKPTTNFTAIDAGTASCPAPLPPVNELPIPAARHTVPFTTANDWIYCVMVPLSQVSGASQVFAQDADAAPRPQ